MALLKKIKPVVETKLDMKINQIINNTARIHQLLSKTLTVTYLLNTDMLHATPRMLNLFVLSVSFRLLLLPLFFCKTNMKTL